MYVYSKKSVFPNQSFGRMYINLFGTVQLPDAKTYYTRIQLVILAKRPNTPYHLLANHGNHSRNGGGEYVVTLNLYRNIPVHTHLNGKTRGGDLVRLAPSLDCDAITSLALCLLVHPVHVDGPINRWVLSGCTSGVDGRTGTGTGS